MRLTNMTTRALAFAASLLALVLLAPSSHAQRIVPAGPVPQFKDTSAIKAPAGSKVAIMEFEDLECPACAHASPVIHTAIDHYKIPYLRYDYPLHEIHKWSTDAAITARYLQDKVSTGAADTFRKDVFASQMSIESKEDLGNYTRRWFDGHKLQMPFVMDPSGRFAAEVQAERTMGDRIGLHETPSIFVISPMGWTQVKDVTQLYTVIDNALAEAKTAPAPTVHATPRKPKTAQK